MDVDTPTLRRMRLAGQGLTRPLGGVAEVVRGLFALQSQDLRQAEWAVGARLAGGTVQDVWAAFAAGEVVRSWPMRGTLFTLAPADLRLLLWLTAHRQVAESTPRHRQLGLTDHDCARAADAARVALAGTSAAGGLGRADLLATFVDAGIDTAGQRGVHLIGRLAHDGLLVLGPPLGELPGGPAQGFVLLDEWAPGEPPTDRSAAVAEVVRRYLAGHGPATERDLAWWTKLTLTEVRAGFAAVRDELTEVTCGGASYWTLGEPPDPVPDGVRALAGFDEWVLGYTDRSPVLAPRFFERVVPGMNGVFFPTLVEDGEVVGTWKRVVTRGQAGVTVDPFPGVRARVRHREAAAAVLPFRGEG